MSHIRSITTASTSMMKNIASVILTTNADYSGSALVTADGGATAGANVCNIDPPAPEKPSPLLISYQRNKSSQPILLTAVVLLLPQCNTHPRQKETRCYCYISNYYSPR
jgi:hypothetical protein